MTPPPVTRPARVGFSLAALAAVASAALAATAPGGPQWTDVVLSALVAVVAGTGLSPAAAAANSPHRQELSAVLAGALAALQLGRGLALHGLGAAMPVFSVVAAALLVVGAYRFSRARRRPDAPDEPGIEAPRD